MTFKVILTAAALSILSACGVQSSQNSSTLEATSANKVLCKFSTKDQSKTYSVTGDISGSGVFTVEMVTGGIQPEIEGREINNNPIEPENALDGSATYYIDALSDDPDFGDVFTIHVPKTLTRGTSPAWMEHVYYSRDPRPMGELDGSCSVQ